MENRGQADKESDPVPAREEETPGFKLYDLMSKFQDSNHKPIIPQNISTRLLQSAGISESANPRLANLISLASEQFIHSILTDCKELHKLKEAGSRGGGGFNAGEGDHHNPNGINNNNQNQLPPLTTEALIPVLKEHGITVKKAPYVVANNGDFFG